MVRNSGAINAKVGGDDAVARAIVDLSGHVAMVENSGAISATGATDAADNIAIDLSANNGGATVKQTAVASGATAPSIPRQARQSLLLGKALSLLVSLFGLRFL